jgi:radical SAM protein
MKPEALERTLGRYEERPHLVFWETTKACALACAHCRASAQLEGSPDELTTAEGHDLIAQVAAMSRPSPILVFTGGDCLARPDLFELIDHASQLGVRMGVAPSVTWRLDADVMDALATRGVRSASISLDGSSGATHDAVRGVSGHFDQTISALRSMNERGFRLQVNTTVMRANARELADVLEILARTGVSIWEVFFLIGVGRGVDVGEISAEEAEDVCHFLVEASYHGFTVRTVEGPFFRRVQDLRANYRGDDPQRDFDLGPLYEELHERLEQILGELPAPSANPTLATGDGRGIVFVGHDGDVHASGFLPVSLGSIRERPLLDIYQGSELLQEIRSGRLDGACGACAYRRLCGGSRARAYVEEGDALGTDPSCRYGAELLSTS